jgi:hypothetical protein
MRLITGITNDAKQQFDAVIEGYDVATIYLEYKPNQQSWFMDVTWGDFQTKNIKVVTSPNILRQFKNVLPFGVMITGVDAGDPLLLDDWLSNNEFIMLDEADKAFIEDQISG